MKRKRSELERILKLEKQFNKINKMIEKKSLSGAYLQTNVDGTTGAIVSLCALINPGDQDGQRIGLRITPQYIQYRVWTFNEATTSRGCGAFSIVQDRHPDGTLPVITDMYSNGSPLSFIAYQNKARFKELRSHFFEYAQSEYSGPVSGQCYGHTFEGYIKIKEETVYNASNGGITDLLNGKNDYYMVWRSSNTASGNLSYGSAASSRIVYKDG